MDDPHPPGSHFPVFLSSLTAKLPDGGALRSRLYRDAGASSLIYVDEAVQTRPSLATDSLALADELLRRVRESKVFLCVLAGSSHGSRIPVESSSTAVSFFELELFAAALQRKPIYALRHESFRPDRQMESAFKLLSFAFPEWRALRSLKDGELLQQARRIAELSIAPPARRMLPTFRPAVKRLAQVFYKARAMRGVEFLNGHTAEGYGSHDISLARRLIAESARPSDNQARLTRLWLAIRELNTPQLAASPEPEQLEMLEQALEQWSGAGAWYGLHADMPLGCLAALNTVRRLRERRAAMGALPRGMDVRPAGPLASAKYNAAKHLLSIRDRRFRLLDALADVNEALHSETQDASGLHAVRASINRRLGRVFDAVRDLEQSRQIRERRDASPHAFGDTYVELGFAYLHAFRIRKGQSFCEEGVDRLRASNAAPAELARGLRKLAIAYAVNGKAKSARSALEESRALARQVNAHDQMS
jgi:tetratricopeptide (TPR) repeat protein